MTIAELREKTKDLEEVLAHSIEDFERLNKARVASVQVCEPYRDRNDKTSRNQEIKVGLEEPLPAGFRSKEKKDLGRFLRRLLREYERETGCRVTEMLVGLEGNPVEVRTDVLAYPERLLATRSRALEEGIEGLLDSFERDTQGQVTKLEVTRVGPEEYAVKVRTCSKT